MFAEGGANKVGPGLYGVLGRKIAAVNSFAYSPALSDFGVGKVWTYDLLSTWLRDSKVMVPGSQMVYPGIKKPEKRAEILAYLRSLSSDPVPLP